MTESSSQVDGTTRLFTLAFFAVLAFVAIIHGALWAISTGQAFVDGDGYLRLIRIERLLETLDWFDITIPDANAPFGTTVHWTRLFDVVVLAIAAPIMLFTDSATAVFWAGIVVSPIIHLMLAGTLIWALKPLLGARSAYFIGAVSVTQAAIMAFAITGRADHHMMFILLASIAIGFMIRMEGQDKCLNKRSNDLFLGVTLAMGIWVGPEFLMFSLLVMVVAGLSWIADQAEADRVNLRLAVGLFGGLVVMLMIERGISGFGDVEYDRISLVHVSFAGLILLFWYFARYVRTLPLRLVYGAISAVVLGGAMILLFPKFASNPLNDADPAMLPIYALISEYQPVSELTLMLVFFGSAVFASPWLVWRLLKNWQGPFRWTWLLLGAGFVLYVGFAVSWIRWSLYAALFISIFTGDLIAVLDARISRRFRFPGRVPLKAAVIFGLSVGPLIIGGIYLHARKSEEELEAARTNSCPVRELSDFLNRSPLGDSSKIIVASSNFGPEIIYRTDHKVLATTHHRGAAGILDGYRILSGTDDEKIVEILTQRQVDLLILCPGSSSDDYFLLKDDPRSLYRRLENTQLPDWAIPVVLPDELSENFMMFRTVGSAYSR